MTMRIAAEHGAQTGSAGPGPVARDLAPAAPRIERRPRPLLLHPSSPPRSMTVPPQAAATPALPPAPALPLAEAARTLGLSPQQMLIVEMILAEEKDQAIALRLGIGYNAVRKQISRIYTKLGVHTKVGVAVRVYREVMRSMRIATEITTSLNAEVGSRARRAE